MQITAEIVASFRADAITRAFSDDVKWPDDIVAGALCEADAETGSCRWGAYEDECHNLKRRGLFYFAAHWLSITYPTGAGATDPSNVPATARLNLAAKSVGDESVQYRITAIQETENDWLSLTNYGVQFLRLRRRVGMGAKAV